MEIRNKIPCSVIRGGTSKGIYFLEQDIPAPGKERDLFLLQVMGSPDTRQINGLGGGSSVTSKVAIVGRSDRDDADVNYTFAQVSVEKPIVSYKGNCGNISAGVGPFAIECGLVRGMDPVTKVRIYNTNTDKIIEAEVPVESGKVRYLGDYTVAGVPGKGAPIRLNFRDPSGTLGHGLLPTGCVRDQLQVPGIGEIEVSIVDAANPLVFVRASDVGLKGTELPAEMDRDGGLLERLERIRGTAAVYLGLTDHWEKAAWETPGVPKMTILTTPISYETTTGRILQADEVDLVGRMMSMQKTHPTYALTGAMCTAAAAAIPGSIAAEMVRVQADMQNLSIGHPGGVLKVGVQCRQGEYGPELDSVSGFRTANLLMEGMVVLKYSCNE